MSRTPSMIIMWEIVIELSKTPSTVQQLSKRLNRNVLSVARAVSQIPPGVIYVYDWQVYSRASKVIAREIYACELELIHENAPMPERAERHRVYGGKEFDRSIRISPNARQRYVKIVLDYRASELSHRDYMAVTGVKKGSLERALSWAKLWEAENQKPLNEHSWK